MHIKPRVIKWTKVKKSKCLGAVLSVLADYFVSFLEGNFVCVLLDNDGREEEPHPSNPPQKRQHKECRAEDSQG